MIIWKLICEQLQICVSMWSPRFCPDFCPAIRQLFGILGDHRANQVVPLPCEAGSTKHDLVSHVAPSPCVYHASHLSSSERLEQPIILQILLTGSYILNDTSWENLFKHHNLHVSLVIIPVILMNRLFILGLILICWTLVLGGVVQLLPGINFVKWVLGKNQH